MGFRNVQEFNLALIANQCWRIIHEPSSLWVKVLKERSFPNTSFLEAKKGSRASWAWTSLLEGRELLLNGAHWQVIDENSIKLWEDRWIPSLPARHPNPNEGEVIDRNQRVASIICEDTGVWNLENISSKISIHELSQIKELQIGDPQSNDRLVWPMGKNRGNYTVISEYYWIHCKDIRSRIQHPTSSLQISNQVIHAISCVSIVIRDARGKFVVARKSPLKAPKVSVAETIAVLEGCMLAKQLGIKDVVIEFDSKETISCLQSSIKNGSWEALPALRKIRKIKVPRSTNMVAEYMASPSIAKISVDTWVNRPPSSLVHILDKDGLPCPPSV
ncbi:hypothetical protein ACFX2J_018927 [Malus domestica]